MQFIFTESNNMTVTEINKKGPERNIEAKLRGLWLLHAFTAYIMNMNTGL